MADPAAPRGPTENRENQADRHVWPIYLAIGFAVAFLLMRPTRPGNPISYSELKKKIEAGQVEKVEIAKDHLRAVPSDAAAKARGERWYAVRVEDPGLIKLLDERHIAYTGVAEGD